MPNGDHPYREPDPPPAMEQRPDYADLLKQVDRCLTDCNEADCTRILLAFAALYELPIVAQKDDDDEDET